ncbi:MAG: putative dithiol-disulfide oxidoreductase, family [Variovorax sp.]|nr:putative dithiol-disulfide oxidoreductase, family [Variovorax sp.]
MNAMKPAAELAAAASKPYPNDSADYRKARTALLAEEIELRRHIERVAAQRRALPPGGEAPDYGFRDENGTTVKLADMFGPHDTLVTYFWMFGPERKQACPMCTSFLGAIDTPARDISQKVAVAVIGRSPVERQLAFARERGWRNLKFYATIGDDFARDYRGLAPDGNEWPALDVWVKRDGKVLHFWGSELGGTADPGEDARGAPDPTPLWNILDLTPAGRGSDWYPKLAY